MESKTTSLNNHTQDETSARTDEQILGGVTLERDAWKHNFKWLKARLCGCKNMDDISKLLKDAEQVRT